MGYGIQLQIRRLETARRLSGPAKQGAQAGQQFGKRERFGEIVVGTGFKPGDLVLDGLARGQQQNRRAVPIGPESPADGKAIQLREHEVQDDQIIRIILSQPQSFFPIDRHINGVALFLKALLDEGRHIGIVFDDKNPHDRALSLRYR